MELRIFFLRLALLLLLLGVSGGCAAVVIGRGSGPDNDPLVDAGTRGADVVKGQLPDAPLSPAMARRMLWGRQDSCGSGYGRCPGWISYLSPGYWAAQRRLCLQNYQTNFSASVRSMLSPRQGLLR
jgi:hypothetical protein